MKAPNLQRDGFWYVLVFGASHAWITYAAASLNLNTGAWLGFACILIWLILLVLVRYEIQRQARAAKTFPAAWTRPPVDWEAERRRMAAKIHQLSRKEP